MNVILIYFLLPVLLFIDVKSQGFEGLGDLAKMFSMMSGQDSCQLKCPHGREPTKNNKHVPSSNGCGSMGLKLDVSEYPGFNDCCNRHDKCYDTCNSDRDHCDEEFKDCLNDACDLKSIHQKLSSEKHEECKGVKELMYSGTVGLGCASYKEAQRNACLCNGKKLSIKEMKRLDELEEL